MKTIDEIPNKLADFLSGKGVLNQFIYNCQNFDREGDNGRTLNLLNAFQWDATPEGYDFWSKLQAESTSI